MRTLLAITLIVGLARVFSAAPPDPSVALVAAIEAASQSKPVTEHTARVGDRQGDPTLSELWEGSDLVAEVSVGQSRPTDYLPAGRPPSIFTTYDCHVVALFKTSDADVAIGQAIPVRRNGGLRDRGDHLDNYQPANEFRFAQGDRYILFLRRRQWMGNERDWGVYYVETVSAAGTFKIVGAAVETKGQARVTRALHDTRADEFREQLQRLGRTR